MAVLAQFKTGDLSRLAIKTCSFAASPNTGTVRYGLALLVEVAKEPAMELGPTTFGCAFV